METIQPDTKNTLYQQTMKKGDELLHRVQKLDMASSCPSSTVTTST